MTCETSKLDDDDNEGHSESQAEIEIDGKEIVIKDSFDGFIKEIGKVKRRMTKSREQ